MSIRAVASFAVAIFLGLIAVLLVRNYLVAHSGGAGPGGAAIKTVPVVVASLPIARGATLQISMLKVVNYPENAIPTGHFQNLGQLVGNHVALRSIGLNEPVLADRITGAGAKAGMSGALAPGMRAVAIKASDVTAVSGFALPGDRVDVLLTRNIGSGDSAQTVTQVVADNVRVLAVDQTDNSEANQPVVSKSITVECTPDQAQAITIGQTLGTVSLTLRQLSDDKPEVQKSVTAEQLGTFGVQRAKPSAAPAAPAAPATPTGDKPNKLVIGPGQHEVRVTRGTDTTGYAVGGN